MHIQKVAEVDRHIILIVGESGTGRTTHALNLTEGHNPLWVSFTNVGVLPEDIDVAVPDVAEFETFVKGLNKSDVPSKYNVLVLDGALEEFVYHYLPEEPQLRDWAIVGRKVTALFTRLKKHFPQIVIIALLHRDEANKPTFRINPDLKLRVITHFDDVHYCYTRTERDEQKNTVTRYGVQTKKSEALKFKMER